MGVGDFIAKIDREYSERLCKEAVFEFVKENLVERAYAKIKEMANDFVGRNS